MAVKQVALIFNFGLPRLNNRLNRRYHFQRLSSLCIFSNVNHISLLISGAVVAVVALITRVCLALLFLRGRLAGTILTNIF